MPPEAPRARRLLGERLAAFRTRKGLSVRALGDLLEIDGAQVSRIQTGKRLPDEELVKWWLAACGVVKPEPIEETLELLDQAHARTVTWRSAMRAGSVQHLDAERLDAARLVCSYQPVRVPGLLQSRGYARIVLRELGAPGTDVERSVDDRLANQRALQEPGRRFVFVIGERVLARDYGHPRILTEQRARLDDVAGLSSVEVLVLPDALLVPEVPFTIYDEPVGGAEPVVAIETPVRGHAVEAPEDVAAYRDLFARLRHAARPL